MRAELSWAGKSRLGKGPKVWFRYTTKVTRRTFEYPWTKTRGGCERWVAGEGRSRWSVPRADRLSH